MTEGKIERIFPSTILGSPLYPAKWVKNLGVWFDSDFSLSKHVQNVCKSCFVQLHDFRHVRQFLTQDASVLVASALVSSWLDYCNSLFMSLSKFNLRKLQCIQNSAARIVSNTSRYTSATPVLKKLHWLPVEHRSVFKTATLVYEFLHTGFPKYSAPGAEWWKFPCHSVSFPSFNPQSINLSNNLVIVLLLMLLLFGMLFLGRFVCPPISPPSENASKSTFTPKHTLLSLTYPWRSPWCSNSFLSLVIVIEIVDCFCFVAP